MAQTGIVGDYKGSQAGEALLTLENWDAMKARQAAEAERYRSSLPFPSAVATELDVSSRGAKWPLRKADDAGARDGPRNLGKATP